MCATTTETVSTRDRKPYPNLVTALKAVNLYREQNGRKEDWKECNPFDETSTHSRSPSPSSSLYTSHDLLIFQIISLSSTMMETSTALTRIQDAFADTSALHRDTLRVCPQARSDVLRFSKEAQERHKRAQKVKRLEERFEREADGVVADVSGRLIGKGGEWEGEWSPRKLVRKLMEVVELDWEEVEVFLEEELEGHWSLMPSELAKTISSHLPSSSISLSSLQLLLTPLIHHLHACRLSLQAKFNLLEEEFEISVRNATEAVKQHRAVVLHLENSAERMKRLKELERKSWIEWMRVELQLREVVLALVMRWKVSITT